MMRAEKLSNEKAEKEEDHANEIEYVIAELKSSVVEDVWEADI